MMAESVSSCGPVLVVSLYGKPCLAGGIRMEPLGRRTAKEHWGSRQGGMFALPPDERARLSALVDEFCPDTVILEHVALAGLLEGAPPAGMSVIFDMHNIESDLARRMAEAEPVWRFGRRRRMLDVAGRLAAAEQRIQGAASAIWVCSRQDQDRWKALTGQDAYVVPNTIPPLAEAMPLRRRNGTIRPSLIFVGHLRYAPNRRAVQELCSQVLPALRRARADTHLTIAGRDPGRRVKRLAKPDVRIVPNATELSALLSKADITVIPLREGGGTRIKILEAIASGVLVVATDLAVEGLELEHGRHFIRAETGQQMADAVMGLIADPARAEDMRDEARAFIMQRYSQAAVTNTIRRGLAAASRKSDAPAPA
jgi:glycosyltransferase involved in cell wall biosynthesis